MLHNDGMAARCEAEIGILDEHRPSREDPTRCRVCTAITENGPVRYPTPCKTVRILAEGYRYRNGWEQYWGSGGHA
jgi:hypothetical protein